MCNILLRYVHNIILIITPLICIHQQILFKCYQVQYIIYTRNCEHCPVYYYKLFKCLLYYNMFGYIDEVKSIYFLGHRSMCTQYTLCYQTPFLLALFED